MNLHQRSWTAGKVVLLGLMLLTGFRLALARDKKAKSNQVARRLVVGNEAGKEITVSDEIWNKLPRRKVTLKGRDGAQVNYEGTALVEVLRRAGVPFGKHLRGPRVANYVLVEAADGYRALLALAEVDPSTTDQVVLVADRKDGKRLPAGEGPYRLVVPQDKIHSRWVKQVTRISVGSTAKRKVKRERE